MQITQQTTQEIPETILDQLMHSKINGMPFFPYTGIKAYNLEGNDTLFLKSIPRNPKAITNIQITYDAGRDSYKLYFFKKNQRTIPDTKYDDIYFDQLAGIIARDMGVN